MNEQINSSIEQRIQHILLAKEIWLTQQQTELQEAIEKTIRLGFSRSDVHFALRWAQQHISHSELTSWVNKVTVAKNPKTEPPKVIFLHAGNLPLVGLQDVIAAILSGVKYYGKLSKKDPYLLQVFLDAYNSIEGVLQLRFSTTLVAFENIQADSLVFSGSDESVSEVQAEVLRLQIVKPNAATLIRTAHFSIVWFERDSSRDWQDLYEAIFRYNGAGCRSVAVIVSPNPLHIQSECRLADYSEWWQLKENQLHNQLSDNARYYKAYYDSVGIPTKIWGNKLLVETLPIRLLPDLVYWIQGGEAEIRNLQQRFGSQVQCVYATHPFSNDEPLYKAQNPDLFWKPDGIDTLHFLSSLA